MKKQSTDKELTITTKTRRARPIVVNFSLQTRCVGLSCLVDKDFLMLFTITLILSLLSELSMDKINNIFLFEKERE